MSKSYQEIFWILFLICSKPNILRKKFRRDGILGHKINKRLERKLNSKSLGTNVQGPTVHIIRFLPAP